MKLDRGGREEVKEKRKREARNVGEQEKLNESKKPGKGRNHLKGCYFYIQRKVF